MRGGQPARGSRHLTGKSPIIRPLREDELSALIELYRHLHVDDAELPGAAEVEAIWRELRSNPALHLFGAEAEGRLVATCLLAIIPNLTRGGRPYGLIENVVTHADFRKRGIATRLLHHALERAWHDRCYKVMLMTGRQDDATLRFYRQAGFIEGAKAAFTAYPPSAES